MPETQQTKQDLAVPMPDVVRFVRQLSHDLRNHLNAAELQSAYLKEVAADAELKDEVQRLRGMLSEMGGNLQKLTAALAPVKLTEMPYEAADFVEDLQGKIEAQFPDQSGAIEWKVNLQDATLQIDPQVLQQAFLELFANAIQHGRGAGPLRALAEITDREFTFELKEPKTGFESSTENWGRQPFRKLGHGHYGLGLHRARSIIETHDGHLDARYDPASSTLVTTVVLPVFAPE